MPAIDSVEYLQNAPAPGYSARQLRGSFIDAYGEGVFGSGDYRVTFNAGLTVNVAAGTAYVRGVSTSAQGLYKCDVAATKQVTLNAADATNPRIDQIVLQVRDSAEDAGANNDGQVTFIAGTPTPGATLDNRAGAGPLTVSSPSLIVLADVLVNAANSPALSNTNIRDRRPFGLLGVIPSSVTASVRDQVTLINPALGLVGTAWNTNYSTRQTAMAMFLPRRIAATHIRWRYLQGANNSTATYNLGICDASGRLIAQTGAQALAGANNIATRAILPFSPALPAGFVFDAGWYYVWAGVASIGSTAAVGFLGYTVDNGTFAVGAANNAFMAPQINLAFRSAAAGAGTTFDASNTFLGLTDAYNDNGQTTALPIPQIALSIG